MVRLWKDPASDVRVVRLTTSKEVETLIRLFESIAQGEGWQPDGALRRGTQHSVYFAVELNRQLVGGLQLVLPDEAGTLPCQTVWPEVTLPAASRPAHIAILALDAAVRGKQKLFWPLTAEMWRYCVGQGIATLFLEVTPRVSPLYRRLGWPLVKQGEQRLHWGEECGLYSLGVADTAQTLLHRAEQSFHYQQIVAQMFRVTMAADRQATGKKDAFQAAPL